MKQKKALTIITGILAASGILLICLPALLNMSLSMYKYFIYSGAVTLSMTVIVPEIIKGLAALHARFFRSFA